MATDLSQKQSANQSKLVGADSNGVETNYAAVSITGAQSVSMDPVNLFSEAFDGVVIDTTNRWNTPVTVGAGAVTQTGGNLAMTVGTAANAAAQISSQPLFATSTGAQIPFGIGLKIEGTIATGTHRFFGFGTQGTAYSTTNPIKDGIGFEITTAGILRAVLYSADVLVYSQIMSIPTDNATHTYLVIARGNVIFWYLDAFDTPVAATTFINPSNSNLPIRFHILNGGSTTVGTPIMTFAAIGVLDQGRNAQGISDGTYPWRKTTVTPNSELRISSISDNSGVQGAITVSTSAVAVRVGGSNLTNRKTLSAHNNTASVTNTTLYWGYTSGVTTTTGTPLVKNQFASWEVGPNTTVYLIAVAGSHDVRVTESA